MGGSDLLTGTLELVILKILGSEPLHGYSIGRRIRETSEETIRVGEGVLYPALHRLEERGFLQAEWGLTDTGREAKFYELTATGRQRLRDETERWTATSNAVLRILTE